MSAVPPGRIGVILAWSGAQRQVEQRELQLPAGSSVADALVAAGLDADDWAGLGIWGRRVTALQALRDGDRIELYRGLRVDPRHARRERFQQQGARAAGLFSRRRPGAKPGY